MVLEDRDSPSLQQGIPPPEANGIQSLAEPQQRNEEQEAVIDERPQNELQNRVINEEERLENGAESETGQLEQQVHAQEEAAALSEDPLVADSPTTNQPVANQPEARMPHHPPFGSTVGLPSDGANGQQVTNPLDNQPEARMPHQPPSGSNVGLSSDGANGQQGMAAAANVFFIQDIPHGYVKRVMWFKYLQAFIAKTQQSPFIDQTIICDVFAGTGRYNKEWSPCYTDYGSPLVALGAAIRYFIWKRTLPCTFEPIPDANPNLVEDDSLMLKEYKIVFNFVEKVTENCKSLIKNIILFFNFHGIGVSKTQQLSNQVCVSSIGESVSIQCKIFNCEFTEFSAPNVPDNARMATFIDPFEFKMIPSQHVSQFVGKHKELSINLMKSSMNRFFTMGMDPELLLTLKETAEQSDFVDALANLYAEKLEINDPENRNHVLTFEMRDKRNVRLYHLVFATSHIEGLKSMKESLNRGTQEQHTFSLSDYKILRKNIPLNLGNQQDPNAVADVIFNEFKGRLSVSIKDIEMFVWLDTPYVHRKKPLAILEKAGKIVDVVPQRLRRYTFPDSTELLISFASE